MARDPLPTALRVARPSTRREWAWLGGASAVELVRIAAVLARPWPLALAVDHALDPRPAAESLGWLPGQPVGVLVLAAVAGALLTGLVGLLDMTSDRLVGGAVERIGANLRGSLFDRAMTRSVAWHDRVRSGELVSRLTTDVDRVLDAVVAVTTTLLPDVVMLLAVLGLLAALDGDLALVALSVVPVLAWLAARQRHRVRGAQRTARDEAGRLVASTNDLVRNVRVVQAFGRHDLARDAFGTRNSAVLRAETDAVGVEARWTPVPDVVLAIGTAGCLLVGGLDVLAGTMTLGTLLVAVAYIRDLYAPVRGLTRLSTVLAKAGASASRVAEVLDCEEAIPEPTHPRPVPALREGIRFERVGFEYEPRRPVVDGLDLEVAAGEMVCLVGPSGAGKSTLLHLLLRLHDVTDGRILLDGVDLRDLSPVELRKRVAFMPQDPWLLDASLADNIAFGCREAQPDDVLAAARAALVDEFAAGLPYGYATVLGEGGSRLSGGQRRRVALARAAVSRAPLMVLDEPTASLDAAAAEAVRRAIRSATRGRTVLIATHDARLAALADRTVDVAARSRETRDLMIGDETRPLGAAPMLVPTATGRR